MLNLIPASYTQHPVYILTINDYGTVRTPVITTNIKDLQEAFFLTVIDFILNTNDNAQFFFDAFPNLNNIFAADERPTAEEIYRLIEAEQLLDSMLTKMNDSLDNVYFAHGDETAYLDETKCIPKNKGLLVIARPDITFDMIDYVDGQETHYTVACHAPDRVKMAINAKVLPYLKKVQLVKKG